MGRPYLTSHDLDLPLFRKPHNTVGINGLFGSELPSMHSSMHSNCMLSYFAVMTLRYDCSVVIASAPLPWRTLCYSLSFLYYNKYIKNVFKEILLHFDKAAAEK